ncbi:MAG TPA: DUF2304 domain-containing protein [Acidimicrobiales bacterium]
MRLNLFIFVVAALTLAFILELVRRRHLREKYALLWLAVGVMLLAMSLGRPLVDRLSVALGVTYGPTMIFALSTAFLAGVAAHLSYEVSKLEERTRRLAEEIALMRPLAPAGPSSPGAPGAGVPGRE